MVIEAFLAVKLCSVQSTAGNLNIPTQEAVSSSASPQLFLMNAPYGTPSRDRDEEQNSFKCEPPPFLTKLYYAHQIYFVKGLLNSLYRLRDIQESFYPPAGSPDIVKSYECRPGLPVRIFLPASYDQTSPDTLPTIFTIHGGGFCIGRTRNDDEWNRAFADSQHILVVALNYSKAPEHPFPTAVHDLGALIHAVLADESLPIDRTPNTEAQRSRTAILGFSGGGNFALAVSQLPSIRAHECYPAAAISCYGYLDMTIPAEEKLVNRPWKRDLLPPPRNAMTEPLMALAPVFDWAYIPYGQDLRDPFLSPYFAPRDKLPPYVFVLAAELDMMAHESWRFACRLAREGVAASFGSLENDENEDDRPIKLRQIPDRKSEDPRWRVVGQENRVGRAGELISVGHRSSSPPTGIDMDEEEIERFAFEENWGTGGVKWLLVPDVMHGFDNRKFREKLGGQETIEDAELKTDAYRAELGRWLKETVWRLEDRRPGESTWL